MQNEKVLSFLDDLTKQIEASLSGDDRARQDAVTSCFMLAKTLETPSEAMVRLNWVEPSFYAAFRTASDMSLFDHLMTDNGAPKSSAQLALMTSTDQGLILRIMRVLVSMGVVGQLGSDSFTPSPLAKSMTQDMFKEALNYMYDFAVPTHRITPNYLAARGYANPSNALDCTVQYWFDTTPFAKPDAERKLNFFEISAQLNVSKGLAAMMGAWQLSRPHWSDDDLGFYPVKQRLIKGAENDPQAAFIVDVGGSIGTDLQKFLDRHPSGTFPGRVILQDLPEMITAIKPGSISEVIEPTYHDFFTPQPVPGARAYFMHSIIHDHPDERATLILQHIAKAMKPGYSKLLLWDHVLPEQGIAPAVVTLDWTMMTFFAASERSESDWRRLIESSEVGMKLTGIWKFSQFDQCVIEAELA